LLGPVWRPTYPLVLPTTLFIMGGCVSAGAGTYMHALAAAKRSLRAALFTSAAYLVGALIGAAVGGAVGTMYGATVATWIGALVFWWQLRLTLRERRNAPAGQPSPPVRSAGKHRKPPGRQRGGGVSSKRHE
jgi:predicted MFS family arabinose efflux permease